jgi:chromate transporter
MSEAPPAALNAPGSPRALFWACTRLALQGFGGVLPVAQRELVERLRWLSREDFMAMLSLAQVLPGPNIVNLALIIGDRHFGTRGAAAALAGILAAPLAVVLVLAVLAQQAAHWPAVPGALRGMGIVAAGLILATVWRLAKTLRGNALGLPLCAGLVLATMGAIAGLRWPLVAVVLGLGGLAVGRAYLLARRAATQGRP